MDVLPHFYPKTLYKYCITCYVKNLKPQVAKLNEIDGLRNLPASILADLYLAMADTEETRDILFNELSNLQNFMRLLKFCSVRQKMIKCFSVLMCAGHSISNELSSNFVMSTKFYLETTSLSKETLEYDLKQISSGLRLGTFLLDSGWIEDSIKVLNMVLKFMKAVETNYSSIIVKLDCLQRLLHSQIAFCCFTDANQTSLEAIELIKMNDKEELPKSLLAVFYKALSMLYFAKSKYSESYEWSVKALELIGPNTPEKIAIDVLRQASKACVVKREFNKAKILILKAVKMARNHFGENHQKYADSLLDYGFFLLNVDAIVKSVQAYKQALDIKQFIHGNKNLAVATAEEDLSYALYVLEYSSGNFQCAKDHICKSIDILKLLLPVDHLLLSSARRVKALILEEIAIDNSLIGEDSTDYHNLLLEAEELHQSALKITMAAFGEDNVQTAKHYGNLGRLYQSMGRYEEAEELHNRAIKIKIDILGPRDYEVGLSIGHLASLYSYHMKKFREAEILYLRSITISLKLFGESYSGLEYDYKGLCNVYDCLGENDKLSQYSQVLERWRMLREAVTSYNEPKEEITLDEVREKFFDMCKNQLPFPESTN